MSDLFDALNRSRQTRVEMAPSAGDGRMDIGGVSIDLKSAQHIIVSSLEDEQDRVFRARLAENAASDTSVDLSGAYARWDTAKAYAKIYNVPASDAFSNIEGYDSDFFGKTPDYKTAPKAILDSALAQVESMKVGKLYTELMLAEGVNGILGIESGGFSSPSAERSAEILAEIEEIKKKMAGYSSDIIPRGALVKLAKTISSATPYTVSILGTTAAAGAAVTAAGATLGLSSGLAMAAIKSSIVSLVGFAAGSRIMIGLEYGEMIDRGIDPKEAAKWATLSGAGQAAIEQFLGIEGAVSGAMSKGVVGRVTERFIEKLHVSGALTTAAKIYGARVASSAIGEMGEEGSGALLSGIATLMAQSATEEGLVIDPIRASHIARNVAESMINAAITAPFLGLAPDILMTISDTKRLKNFAGLASGMSEDDFVDSGIKSGVLDGVTLPEDKKKEALRTMHKAQVQTAEDAALAGTEAARRQATEGTAPSSVVRTESGSLRVDATDAGTSADGTQTVSFTAGAAKGKGNVYGAMSADVTADSVTITDSDIEGEYLPLAGEIIGQIAARYPGRQILIDPKADEGVKAAYEQFVRERTDNPFAEVKERDPEVAMLLEQHRAKLLADGVDKRAARVATVMFDIMSQAGSNNTGKSQAEFLRSFDVAGKDIENDSSLPDGTAGYHGMYPRTSLNASAPNFAKSILAIYSSKTPDVQLDTAAHEPVHLFRSWMSDNARDGIFSEFEKEYGVKDGKWTKEADEVFVEDWTRWLREKKASSPSKSTIFERLGRLLRSLFDAMQDYAPLSPRLREQFDLLMEGVSVGVSEGEGWNTHERASKPYAVKYEKDQHPDTKAYRDAERKRYDAAQKIISDAALAQGNTELEATRVALEEAAQAYKVELEAEIQSAIQPPVSVLTAPLTEDGEHFAETPEAEKSTSALNPAKFASVEFEIASILHSPEIKNFKAGADKNTGEVIKLRSEQYERMGTAPIVLWERLDGKTYIVTGRHRLGLAQRLNEKTIPSQVVREADGFSLAMARAFDAESNIRDDQGSVKDYVTYFKYSGISEADARAKGLLGRAKGSAGFAIANHASEGLYSLYMAGGIGETKAAVIATIGRGKSWLQSLGIKTVKAKKISPDELASFLEVASRETQGIDGALDGFGEAQPDMFGDDDASKAQSKRWEAISEAVAKHVSALKNEEHMLSAAIRMGGEAASAYLESYGHRSGDIEGMKARQEELYFALKSWDGSWSQNPYRWNEALKLAGLKYDESLVEPDLRVREQEPDKQEMLFNVSRTSAIEARAAQIEDGTWVANPQLVAELKVRNGIELSQYESDLLSVAEQYADDPSMPDLLFNITGENESDNQKYADQFADAKDYESFEEWLSAMFSSKDTLTENDRTWLRARFEHAQKQVNGKRKYEKPGDFAKAMSTNRGVATLIAKLEKAIYSRERYASEVTKARGRKIDAAISRTPELKRLVASFHTDGKAPSPQAARQLLRDMKEYEALYKYLYAVLDADEDLAHEAFDDMREVPELIKRELTGKAGRTIAEQQYIIDALRFDRKYDQIASGKATLEDIESFIDGLSSDREEEITEFADSARAEAQLAMDRQKDKERAKAALRKERSELLRLRKFIFTDPSGRVDLEQASIIRFIQDYLRSGKPVDPEALRSAGSFMLSKMPGMATVIAQTVDRINGRDFSQWSISEVEEVAEIIDGLLDKGRQAMRDRELAFGYEAKAKRGAINDALRNGKHHLPPVAPESEEDLARRRGHKMRKALFDADRPDAWVKKYLGQKAYELLFSDTVDAHRLKYEQYDRRIKPVLDFIARKKMVKNGAMYRKIFVKGVGPEGSDMTITGAELLGIRLMYGRGDDYNREQREAFIFGNLFSADEKNPDGNLTKEGEVATNQRLRDAYVEKSKAVEALLEESLTADEEDLARLMIGVSDNDQDWSRFANAIYQLANKEPEKGKFYFPIFRSGSFGKGEDAILEELKNSGMTVATDQGMAISRIKDIQPRNQRPVQINAMKVFFSAIEKQEHLINVGLHAKLLRGVFVSQTFGDAVMPNIMQSLGKEATDYIKAQIDTITNPAQWKERASGGKLLGAFRGSIVISNLAFRWSSVVMQAVTSPLPFLSEVNPAQLLAVSIEAAGDMKGFVQRMEAESAILRHRQMTPEVAYLEQRIEQGVASRLERFSQMGMKPLTLVDRYSVAIGWEAVRRAKLAEFRLDSKIDDVDAQMAAAAYADEVVIKTQPTAEDVYRAPMYRNMDEYKQLVLQFTQPLNVIWNNIRNDIPQAARDREFEKIAGFIVAYALSGLAVGAIAVARGRGPEEPDEEKWARYILHAATTQFTDAVPLVGGILTSLTRKAIVGDIGYLNDMNMPAASGLARAGIMAMGQDPDYGKIAKTLAASIGQFAGAPVKGAMDVWELGKAIAGEE